MRKSGVDARFIAILVALALPFVAYGLGQWWIGFALFTSQDGGGYTSNPVWLNQFGFDSRRGGCLFGALCVLYGVAIVIDGIRAWRGYPVLAGLWACGAGYVVMLFYAVEVS